MRNAISTRGHRFARPARYPSSPGRDQPRFRGVWRDIEVPNEKVATKVGQLALGPRLQIDEPEILVLDLSLQLPAVQDVLAMRGATVIAIKELAGHRSIRTTMRYMHLSASHKEKTIELLDEARSEEGLGDILETQHTVLEKTEAALQVEE